MEFIVISTALSHVAINLIDRYASKRPNDDDDDVATTSASRGTSNHASDNKDTHASSNSAPEAQVVQQSVVNPSVAAGSTAADASSESNEGDVGDGKGEETGGVGEREKKGEAGNGAGDGHVDDAEWNDVGELRQQIRALRAEATQLTSADTFVEYARVTRRATKLEKRLRELEGDGDNGDLLNVDMERIGRLMTAALTSRGTQGHTSTSSTTKYKIAIRILLFAVLCARFSPTFTNLSSPPPLSSLPSLLRTALSSLLLPWRRAADGSGEVMAVRCALVRPLGWLFRRRRVACVEGDWVCAARGGEGDLCGVSFVFAAWLCNVAVGVVVDSVMTYFVPTL